jgi:hypothetical protein
MGIWMGSKNLERRISFAGLTISRSTPRQSYTVTIAMSTPPGFDMGGMSGGPLLLPYGSEDGEWYYWLGGVICEARSGTVFETVVAVRAHFINQDGTISRN